MLQKNKKNRLQMSKIANLINGNLSDFIIEYRIHASQRMFRRDIYEDDVEKLF